ncbi:MAG: hypothetical protein MUF54_09460 [Polyangiaceae bacterium]|nr:hypothetical protein [Polyangiaceae bacterium]
MTRASFTRLRSAIERLRPALPYAPAALVSAFFASRTIFAILERTGHPAVPLDDAFIHFQFARSLAHGRFFTYVPGEGYVAGATSLLWPLLLAPFWLVGFRELSIIWAAWFFGFAAHAGLTVEVYRLAEGLTGRRTAYAAACMTAVFGAFTWFAASGMETMGLAWVITRTARVAATWCEAADLQRTRRLRHELLVLACVGPLFRPEGVLTSLFALTALQRFPAPGTGSRGRARLVGLLPVAGALLPALLNLLLTGSPSSTTTAVKWLPLSPYYARWSDLSHEIGQNVALMFSTLLNGEQWSAVFVPRGALPIAVAALVCIPLAGARSARPWRAFFVLALALAIFVPCTYDTFLWNRLRYLWPFAPAWLIGIACAARLAGDAAGLVRPRWAAVAPALAGLAGGSILNNVSWTIEDVARSAAAIDQQQVALGRWAREHLPADAILGVNDTGAIAYVSGLKTFDVVGLTTASEGRYWVAGPGSRFEHYERIWKEQPARFPTHFAVYPEWMACEPVLGKRLHEASVFDQTILGGVTMVVYEARTDLLGSGAAPLREPLPARLLDELDVADLESEREHAYEIGHAVGGETSNKVHAELIGEGVQGGAWADGGRFCRFMDRFDALLEAGQPARGIARFVGAGDVDTELVIRSGERLLATVRVPTGRAEEVTFEIPGDVARARTPVEVRTVDGSAFGSLHYWFAASADRVP